MPWQPNPGLPGWRFEQEEITDEIYAFDAADGAGHARRPQAAAADRTEQRALPANAGGAAQARGLCRRGRLRRLCDNRTPLPFEGYETSVAPLMLYTDLAARTKRIKF